MYSTLYIIFSVFIFYLDELPTHLHLLHLKNVKHVDTIYTYSKVLRVLESFGFCVACINQVACIIVLVLKAVGILNWW